MFAPFLAFVISGFQVQARFRAQSFAMIFSSIFDVIVRLSIWQAVYHGHESVDGVSLVQIVTYSLIGTVLFNNWDANQIVRNIGGEIRSGDVVSQLMRPYSYPVMIFAKQLGDRGFFTLSVALPVIFLMSLIYGLEPPASLAHAVLFVLYFAVAISILFTLSIITGLLCFWVLDSLALEWFLRGLLSLFSGGLVPLWFFPSALAHIAHALPFAWITFYPMAVYLGQMDVATSLEYLVFGLGWALALIAIMAFIWSRACRRLIVQGG